MERDKGYYHAVAGAASGCVTRFLCQPLDVIKIRFQLQVEPIKKQYHSKYHSVSQTIFLITKEEKFFALWKGHVPAQILSAIYGTSQFYMYTLVNNYLNQFEKLNDKTRAMHLVSGALAGSFATFAAFPLDIIRTRLIAQSAVHQAYKGTFHSCKQIYKFESIKGFYRGLLPALIQIAPHTGIQFWAYESLKQINFLAIELTPADSTKKVTVINSLIAGSLSGIAAKTTIYPLDLAKKRLQIQGFENARIGFGGFFRCHSLIHCLTLTAKYEGIQGLFKGLGLSVSKAAITTAFQFTFYEQFLNLIREFQNI